MSGQKSEKMTVMVTGVGGGGHGEQIVKALRLGILDYRIIGSDLQSYCSGFHLVDETHVLPAASDPHYIDIVLDICRRNNVQALFHGSEAEMVVMGRNRDKIAAEGIYLPINGQDVLQTCQDKTATARFLKQHGFTYPEFKKIRGIADIDGLHNFPLIVKPSLYGGGSRNVFIVQDHEELKNFTEYLLKHSPEFIVQEYVGTPDCEYTVGILFGADGVCLNSIAVHRFLWTALSTSMAVPNRSDRSDLGPTLMISSGVSQGQVGRFPEITRQCEAIAKALQPTAPINIQCRFVENQVLVFEINPRFSGTTSLRAMAGYNEPDVLIRRDVLGESFDPHFSYEDAVVMRGLSEFKMPVI